MPHLGANYEKPQHPRPYPHCPFLNTRECQHPAGGMVRLHNGVPVVARKRDSPLLGLHDYYTPNKLNQLKSYLELEISLAVGDTERLGGAWKLLTDIRSDSWSWYTKSESWGHESFQLERTNAMKAMNPKSLEHDFWADIKAGGKAIGMIYPEFVAAEEKSDF
jgi:hypothetical protein